MNPLRVNASTHLYLLLLLCLGARAFPTDATTTPHPAPKDAETDEPTFTLPTTPKRPPANSSSVSTTSSLLFKDKKPILTYLLGQPKKHAGVSSPAQLLSPDRYEFFTFDDDGQIVKKLMSVKEIQKIIANNEKGGAEDHSAPIEYYQILTVTPDVESIPSVSRINPNEPLFSIHDVIASVQNVLKSEMNTKHSSPALNHSSFLASASSDHFEILTEHPPFTFKLDLQKTTTPPTTFTLQQHPDPTKPPTAPPEHPPNITHLPVPLLPSPAAQKLSSKEPIDVAASSYKVVSEDSAPLSLSDAHPGLLSNDSFLDMKPITVQQISHFVEPIVQELKTGPLPASSGNFVKVDTVDRSPAVKDTPPETSTPAPITPDLAESVSSVLWQIASENSMIDGLTAATEPVSTHATDTPRTSPTTEVPAQSRSTAKVEKPSESPLIALGNILIPQNRPRPFHKIPLIEKGTPDPPESRIDPSPSSTPPYDPPSPTTLLPLTEQPPPEPTTPDTNDPNPTDPSTPPPQTPLISVSPDAVVQSPEHLKPPTDKVALPNNTDSTNQTILAVQVIQEASIGQIPRTTEFPGQVVKDIQRMEAPATDTTDDTLADSPTNTFSTQLPYHPPDTTTLPPTDPTTDPPTDPPTDPTTDPTDPHNQTLHITFVPMLIKTPTEPQPTTTDPTDPPTDPLESKHLPDATPDPLPDDPPTDPDPDPLTTLKQNLPPKPHFAKPQKPHLKPPKLKPDTKTPKPFLRPPPSPPDSKKPYENHLQSSPSVLELDAAPDENLGLEATVANLDSDVRRFADLCNELAFSLWSSVTHNGLSFVRSLVVSPFAVTSLLAMVFLGARGPTSGQMNDILKLDDMVTFNPHLVFRNVTESLVISRNPGVATAAFVRELYSDKSKGKLLDFYKERVQQFYDGHVEEVNFKTVGDTLRRQTNHLVKRQTWGKITDFLRGSNLMPRPPLAAFSANIFQTDCTWASTKDRDGEMYFVILPASRLRRLVPIPAVVWRDSFLAGYEPNLDATAVSISPSDSPVSTLFVLPGQQGLIAPGDTLARLEHHLLGSPYRKGHWSRLLRSLLPRPGLELQIPRLSHKSVINVTASLQRMGLKDLFSPDKADLTGLNGLANDLHLSDMLQVNLFSTCGEEPVGARHHSEVYPATPILRREKSADNIFSDSVDNLFAVSDFEDPAVAALPLELRPRQARVPLSAPGVRVPEPPRLRFDRPFLFFVRHNPTGLILHMGRFNPRLMP